MKTTKSYILEGFTIKANSLLEFKTNTITANVSNVKDDLDDLETLVISIASENDVDKKDVTYLSNAINAVKSKVQTTDNTAQHLKGLASEIQSELDSLEKTL